MVVYLIEYLVAFQYRLDVLYRQSTCFLYPVTMTMYLLGMVECLVNSVFNFTLSPLLLT